MSTLSTWLKMTGTLGVVFAFGLVGYVILRSPVSPPNTLGIRGLQRIEWLKHGGMLGQLDPLLRWLGARLEPLLAERWLGKLDRRLTLAGDFWGLQPQEFAALCLLSLVGGMSGGLSYAVLLGKSLLSPLVCGVFGGLWPHLKVASLEHRRQRQIQQRLPQMIDLLTLGLSAGLDFPGALRQVVEKRRGGDALVQEMELVLRELSLGKTREFALTQLAERAPAECVQEFVAAIVQAERYGTPLDRVLQIQAEVSRQRRSAVAEETASKASVKMLLPLALLFCAVLLLIVSPLLLKMLVRFGV